MVDDQRWDGRTVWERLRRWASEHDRSSVIGAPREALTALTDIGSARQFLDIAELTAVKAARQHGKSWAEIATRLGVTRQSAWEKWRDLDEQSAPAAEDLSTQAVRRVTRGLVVAAENAVVVPDVVGLPFVEAESLLDNLRLIPVAPDPDGPPLAVLVISNPVIVRQHPAAGTRILPGSRITIWLGRSGGSAGVREPRRPRPLSKSDRAVPAESRDSESVSDF